MGEQESPLVLQCPIILIDVNKVDVFELIFKIGKEPNRIFQKQFSVGLIRDHHSRVMHDVLIRHNFFTQKLIVYFVLLSLRPMIQELPQFVKQEDKLLFFNCFLEGDVGRRGWFLHYSLFGGLGKKKIEMFEGCFIVDEASIEEELHKLAKPHGV